MRSNVENTTQLTESKENNESTSDLSIFELEPKQQRFIQLYMTGQYTLTKLAELLNVHPNTVSKWMKRDDIKHAIAETQGEVHTQVSTQLKGLTLKAVNKLHSLIDSPIDAIALQAVKDVLDRGGHKTKNEIKVEKTVTTVEQRMRELIDATISEEIEAEYEEVE